MNRHLRKNIANAVEVAALCGMAAVAFMALILLFQIVGVVVRVVAGWL